MQTQSEHHEHQARQARARMSVTLDELRARMTAGQVADQLADYAREGPAAEFIRNLTREVRENPLPLILIGIGVAWSIIASSRSARARAERAEVARNGSGQMVVDLRDDPELAASVAPPVDQEKWRQTRWQDARTMEEAHEQH